MKRTTIILFLPLISTLLMFLGTSAISDAGLAEAAAEAEGACITSQCHASLEEPKFVHGPVSAGECTICHGEAQGHAGNPRKIKFGAISNLAAKCYECHDRFPAKQFTHSPVADGECTICHDPHGSPNKFQLLAKGGDLCFTCHDEDMVAGAYVHGPAAVGGCVACHDPHTADYEKNLRAEQPAMCYMCHTDKADTFTTAEYVHAPVSGKCTSCHNPHAAAKQFMLSAESPVLCFDCHEDKKQELTAVSFKHGALETDRTCLNCHDAHVSSIAKNLLMEPLDLCLSCHDREYKSNDGTMVTDMKTWLAENTDHHGPIKQKDCSGCHNPHGSEYFRILRSPYPPTFYKPFAIENYNLCFSCHEKTLVLDPETTKLTNFRNGDVNLHFTHVNKPVKGRTCRACHETHASNHPKHIREGVPFGSWELPVNFQKTDTGGSCTPGCHKLKKYDRKKMEING